MASMKCCEVAVTDILVHLMGKCLPNIDDSTRKINCISGSLFKTPGIFNQGRQITKIEIDFESESRECVNLRKNEGKSKSI